MANTISIVEERNLPPDDALFDIEYRPAAVAYALRRLLIVGIGQEFVVHRRDIVDPRGKSQAADLSIEREILNIHLARRTQFHQHGKHHFARVIDHHVRP